MSFEFPESNEPSSEAENTPAETPKTGIEENSEKELRDKTIAYERTLLERFKGKAGKLLRAYMLITSLTNITSPVPAYGAESPKMPEHHDTAETHYSESVSKAEAELSEVKSAEDAEWFMKSNTDPFTTEFYFPTHGETQEISGITVRKPNLENDKAMLSDAKVMQNILKQIHDKFPSAYTKKRIDQLQDVIEKLTHTTSYSGRKQHEVLEDEQRAVDEYQQNNF
jgi:hypothetical protein